MTTLAILVAVSLLIHAITIPAYVSLRCRLAEAEAKLSKRAVSL